MYKAKELPREKFPDIYTIIQGLCLKNSMPMPRVFLIDMPQPNAFATGRNEQHAVVGISPSIMQILTKEELTGVLAHELSHIKNKDMLISTMAATLAGAISLLGHVAFIGGGRDEEGGSNNIASFIILAILTPFIASLIQLAISRTREFEADASGAKLIGHGTGLASALQKLESFAKGHPTQGTPAQQASSHLFIVNPFKPSFLMNLLSTHPSMEERIKRLNVIA
jgi:heat shock protein HtpX